MRKKKEAPQQDISLIAYIQPQGGLHFRDETYIKTGNGYVQCIHVYKLPRAGVDDHWLTKVCNIDNVITTVDIHTEDLFVTKQNINRSLQEQEMRYQSASSFSERHDAEHQYRRMKNLYDELETMDEVMKSIHIRIYISAKTFFDLENRTKHIMTYLETSGYRNSVFLNEGKSEWDSRLLSMSEQSDHFQIPGIPITTETLSAGNPFHFSALEDPYGDYLGETPTMGNVIFDEFHKTDKRLYYNGVIFGLMGSGKSTLLKKRLKSRAIRSDFIRTFDISGEFTLLTKTLGGKVIDSLNTKINPLEILRSTDESEGKNFQNHISKLTTFYQLVSESNDTEEVNYFIRAVHELYEEWGLSVKITNGKENPVTGLPAVSYPTLQDLWNLIDRKMQSYIAKTGNENEMYLIQHALIQYNKVKNTLDVLINIYSSLFNGHTTMDNITDEQLVTFNLSQLKSLPASIFDAYLYIILTLCWDNCVTNGKTMLDLYDAKKNDFSDIVHTMILIDEAHRWINTKKPLILDQITIYEREARKYFGGILLATQSIRDLIPEGSTDANIDKLKNIFEFSQYKFLFRQNSNVIPLIDRVFQSSLTPSLKGRIPKLEMGQCILMIDSDQNLELKIHLTEEEKQLFKGGV